MRETGRIGAQKLRGRSPGDDFSRGKRVLTAPSAQESAPLVGGALCSIVGFRHEPDYGQPVNVCPVFTLPSDLAAGTCHVNAA